MESTADWFDGGPHMQRAISSTLRLSSLLRDDVLRIVSAGPRRDSILRHAVEVPFAAEAISQAGQHLSASADALLTLALTSPVMESRQTLHVTANGWPGLARQALESAAVGRWLLEPEDLGELQERGLASLWREASERISCMRALGSATELEAAMSDRDLLLQQATSEGLTRSRTQRRRIVVEPRVPMPSATDLLRREHLPPEFLAGVDLTDIPGLGNGEWLYRWTSGSAHGYSWVGHAIAQDLASFVETDASSVNDIGIGLAWIRPNTFVIGLATILAYRVTADATSRLAVLHGLETHRP